jgi:hypothetical protein
MSEFRIIQSQPDTYPLPYEVEERRRVWYLPWLTWRKMREQVISRYFYKTAVKRFQTPREARHYIEQLLLLRAQRQAEREEAQARQQQQRQFPLVIEVMNG